MRGNAPLELVHTDVCQVDTKSHTGAQYFVTFIDDHNKRLWDTVEDEGSGVIRLQGAPRKRGKRIRPEAEGGSSR